MNLRSFSLYRSCSYPDLLCQIQANPPGVEFLLDHIQVQKEKSISSSLVYVVHKGDVTRDDLQRRFSRQHNFAMLEKCGSYSKQRGNNVAMLCCTKNRRCESSRVTSP